MGKNILVGKFLEALEALEDEGYALIERKRVIGFLVIFVSLAALITLAVGLVCLFVFYFSYGYIIVGVVLGSVYTYELIGLLRRTWKRVKTLQRDTV